MRHLPGAEVYVPCPSFPCFFWKKARKTAKKTRIFYPYRTPKILGKEGKNAQKKQGIPRTLKSLEKKGKTLKKTRNSSQGEKNKEFPKNKERKDSVYPASEDSRVGD